MSRSLWLVCGLMMAIALPASAELNEVVASQNLTINRGTDKFGKKANIHPKDASKNVKSPLDRFVMLRFDSEAFGKDVRMAALTMQPVSFDGDQPMRFTVYAVRDGDAEDEQFEEKTYDPSAENTIGDRDSEFMLDREQILMVGTFIAKQGETVEFTSPALVQLVRADTNGTVTLVITRNSEGAENSTYAPRTSKTPPKLTLRLPDKPEEADPDAAPEQ